MQRIVVTGSRGGLGRVLTNRLRENGHLVVGIDRPGTGAEVEADLTDRSQAAQSVAQAAENLGGVIDGLVGAAGVVDTVHRAATFPEDAFRSDLETNLVAQLNVAQAVHPSMLVSSAASIVFVASVAGIDGLAQQAAYAVSKAGLIGLTRTLAAEWIADGIRVNAVAPGLFATPKVNALPGHLRDHLLASVPLARVATIDEVAGPIEFLLSVDAGYMTGQVLRIDGGSGPRSERLPPMKRALPLSRTAPIRAGEGSNRSSRKARTRMTVTGVDIGATSTDGAAGDLGLAVGAAS